MTNLVAFEQEMPRESGNLRDIWNNGYFWKGQFTRGADNRLLLTRIIDRLTSVSLQMAEKRTAANELIEYYKHVTSADFPEAQKERLDAWVSRGYNLYDYPIMTEMELAQHRSRECCEYNDALDLGESTGKRKGAMIPFQVADDDDL
ncbi:hypothetical protein [Paenibacillus vini]|uniref:hypothetical protein n=1 Tax=Paenibacillus vini TaxID=1476024 RepID=UPI001BCD39A5|nr:hypothetical protein [Paenibacillus vini]